MKKISNKKVDQTFWDMVYQNCEHVFEWSLQCGEIACEKCYTTYEKHKGKA